MHIFPCDKFVLSFRPVEQIKVREQIVHEAFWYDYLWGDTGFINTLYIPVFRMVKPGARSDVVRAWNATFRSETMGSVVRAAPPTGRKSWPPGHSSPQTIGKISGDYGDCARQIHQIDFLIETEVPVDTPGPDIWVLTDDLSILLSFIHKYNIM